MQFSRRDFFRTSALGATAAAAASLTQPQDLFAGVWSEPQRVPKPGGPILLDSNENPYGPWPTLLASMREAVSEAHRYPDVSNGALVSKIAELHRVKGEQVLAGCGSGEILSICAEVFTGPGAPLVAASPTFESIIRHVRARGREAIQIPLNSRFEHDLDKMAEVLNGKAGLAYICNPNNPTASITPRKAIEAFLGKVGPKTTVLIDEAYHHFALSSPDYTSFLDKPIDDERVIVARTFSKIYGLAGIRVGYAIATPAVIQRMRPFGLPDSVNNVAGTVAVAGLNDAAGLASAIKRNEADRSEFIRQAQQRKIAMVPSQGNFVMVDTGKPIRTVIDHFRANGVSIGRPFPPLNTHARISLGTPPEMKTFWSVWDKMNS